VRNRFFTFSLPMGKFAPLSPISYATGMIYCMCMQQAVLTQLQEYTTWCRWHSLVYGRACKLSNLSMFWLS